MSEELQTVEEQKFGQAGVEQRQFYEPLHPPSPPEEIELDRSEQIRSGVEEILARRKAATEAESTPPHVTRAYQDAQGNRLTPDDGNPKETVSLEQAADDLATMRVKEANEAELNERDALAREIDALRNGTTLEELQAEPPPVVEQQQPVQQPQANDEELARMLQDPRVQAAVSQRVEQAKAYENYAYNQYANGLVQNGRAAAASLVVNFPELNGVAPEQLGTAIKVIASGNPNRAQAILNHIDSITTLVKQGVEAQQALQQRQYTDHRNQFNNWAAQQDANYEALAVSVPQDERHAIEREARKMLNEAGWNDQQIGVEWNNSPSLRSFFGQKMLWDAARGRLNAHRAHAKRVKTAPHVQRPGSPLEREPEADYQLRKLERRGQPLTARQAADLVVAQRAAKRR